MELLTATWRSFFFFFIYLSFIKIILSLAFNKVLLFIMFNGSPRNYTSITDDETLRLMFLIPGSCKRIPALSFTESLRITRY